MSIDTFKVDEVLENLAFTEHKRFNAYQITTLSMEKDVEAVNDYLIFRSHGKYAILEAKIETLCEANNHPDEHFPIGTELPNYEIECRICGDEYIPDINNSHLVFYFLDDFIQRVKKKQLNLSHQMIAI
jgi:hypothetical protein